ncbi:glycosyltransferase family 4 protein [Corynebacterium glutamicum]|uniref:glycosyltransferase family 4 protein n=1 Tax=Corynebacterium glutamicum TaxID=1718 RepID=UPI0007C610A9|nr:glycosyltransferase family 4 protein [Corynebacterium glutamicum]ANE09474.1 glycosyl transferase [Corynebacterium glutamicum]
MKILLLCWRDTTHPQGGGSERYLERVGEFLADQGHEVVFRTAGHTDAPRRFFRDGVRYSRSGGKFSVYPKAWVAMMLGRVGIGTFSKVDVVVDTQNGIPFFGKFFSGKPTVLLTHHCHKEQWPVVGRVLAKVGWLIESQIAPRAYKTAPYVTVSEPSAEELIALGVDPQRIHIVRNDVDPVPLHTPKLDRDGQHAVTLSRLVPHKQIEHAMDVVAALDGVVLDVVGSGWWQEELVDYARTLGVSDRVVFHGQVAEDHKHALLERATIHLMPSRKEGWGLAVTEAAQHGVPTIGYRSSGGLRDSVVDGETGMLVDSKAELISATKTLLIDASLRSKLGASAKQRAENYKWDTAGAQFEELLLGLASKK